MTMNFQEYMTLTDCPYCHTLEASKIASNPLTVRCNTCGICRTLPRMSKEGQRFYYSQIYKGEPDLDEFQWWADDIIEARRLIGWSPDILSNGVLLDVGTADGRFLAALRELGGSSLIGLDPSEERVKRGRKAGLDIQMGRFEPESLPSSLVSRKFDIMCFRNSLETFVDLKEVFELIDKMLQPGGSLYMTTGVYTSIYYNRYRNYTNRFGLGVGVIPGLKAMVNILARERYKVLEAGYVFPENVLNTLHFPLAKSVIGQVVGYGLSRITNVIGKADRIYIFARR